MNQSTSKTVNAANMCRRLAALLVTLALLASMTFPVYAEALENAATADDTQTTASEVVPEESTTSEDNSTPDTTGAEDTTDDETDAADEDNGSDNDETPADDVTTPDAPAEDDTQSDADDVDDNDASDTADTITPADSTDTTPDQDVEEAEDGSLANAPATQATSGIRCIVYFAVPKDWENEGYTTKDNYHIILNVQYAKDGNAWKQFEMEDSGFVTEDARKIYQATIEEEYCPWGGFDQIYIRKFIGDTDQGQIHVLTQWTKMVEADTNGIGNFNDGTADQWSTYTPNYSDHTRLGGQKMVFENKTSKTLTNVTAHFYEPDDNGDLVEVENGSISLNDIEANGKREFSIPTVACSYVRFTTGDGTAISKYYNFYGQAVDGDDKGSFKYFANKTYAYIYNGSDTSMWGIPGTTRVYYDATFSKLSTTSKNDTGGDYSIPSSGSSEIYYRIVGNGKESKSGTLVKDAANENLYYVDVPEGYEKIVFSAATVSDDNQTYGKGKSTAWLTVPTDDKNCYYADTNDTVVYSDNTRDGYWAPVNTLRDAETWKGKDVVNIKNDTFTADSKTKYVDSTLYDYYTDYELNGTARSTYETNFQYGFESHRNWMPFRQFNQALSSYYEDVSADYPIYTGHFQPKYGDWKYPFDEIASALNLYGYSNINRFMAVNNSTLNEEGNQKYYDFTYQGLVAAQTSTGTSAGEPLLTGTTAIEPHFNETFLESENSKNAKLGEVYKNVKFPFTKKQIFDNDKGVDYWYFDSQDTTLYLKQDANNGYFLKPDTSNRERSRNLDAGSKEKTITNASNQTVASYGYFPFNETAVSGCASTYNYGFGTKLQLDFTLTDDGMVETNKTDDEGNKQKTNIKFFFSGDDDVWVFIDGKLALDVGGAHGKVSGLLEFGQTEDGTQNNVTAYVSQVKKGGTSTDDQGGNNVIKSVVYNGQTVNFCAQGGTLPLGKGKTHTLTMYYMERGMWESNMAVAFNFPDHNELEVEKKVDTKSVNELFQNFYTNADNTQFTFNIKNLATHYGRKDAADSTVTPLALAVGDYTPSAGWTGNTCAAVTNPTDHSSGDVIQWHARQTDTSSDWRERRYGTLTLKNSQDIANKQYLSFWMYCNDNNTTGYSLDRIYLQLVDSGGKTLGGDKQYIGSAVYGNVSLVKNQWCKVTLDLGKLTNNGFDSSKLAAIRFGCDYDRCIYWKDFTFTGTAASSDTVGFIKDQASIPDYGSVAKGTLQNATGARYTSNARTGTFAVDTDGEFVLKNNETIRFEDQFRRGSYLSITETPNDSYDTYWTVYENGSPVTSMERGDKVTNGSVSSLEEQPGYAPDDDRTEKKDDTTQDPYKSDPVKPKDANTLVFRSYANPDSGDEGTLTKLKVQFVNKVKVGSLIIKKEGAVESDANNLKGEYKFNITFSNIGGTGSTQTVNTDVTLKCGETETINGIPLNTDYTITEELPNDDSRLAEITVNDTPVSGDTAKGTITSTADKVEVVFKNTNKPLIDLTVKKLWENEQGTDLTDGLPDSIFIQLQRRASNDDNGDWEPVPNQSGSQLYVELTPDYEGNWQYTFTAQDKVVSYENGNEANWKYRVVEGTVKDGKFTASGNTITFGEGTNQKQFTISSSATPGQGSGATTTEDGTISGGSGTITLTNKLQDPRFNLKVLKADAENTGTKLENVEFKLEKLKTVTDGSLIVDTAFSPITGTTDAKGNLLVMKDNQTVEGFTELEAGIYQLTEIKAADGYNLLSGPIQIEFTKEHTCKLNGILTDSNFSDNLDGSYTLALTVLNRKVPELPHTGADAPSLWLLIGLPLAVAGLLILVFRYNKKGGRTK